jgi:predicted XRE-type DNA-binding protein
MKSPIKVQLVEKLADKDYRYRFFRGRSQDEILQQIKELAELRDVHNQGELAELCEMKQSAISRLEKTNFSRWNYNTLWRIAYALDARIRVIIEPMEKALDQYMEKEQDRADLGFQKSLVRNSTKTTNKEPHRPSGEPLAAITGKKVEGAKYFVSASVKMQALNQQADRNHNLAYH